MKAAYLHVLTDLMFSVGVLAAGVIVWLRPEYTIVDPVVTLVFSLMILTSTMGIISKVFAVLLEGVPDHISWEEVNTALLGIEDVIDVHDLHIWAISSEQSSLSCHLVVAQSENRHKKETTTSDIIKKANRVLRKFDIHHTTVQVEEDDSVCPPGTHRNCL